MCIMFVVLFMFWFLFERHNSFLTCSRLMFIVFHVRVMAVWVLFYWICFYRRMFRKVVRYILYIRVVTPLCNPYVFIYCLLIKKSTLHRNKCIFNGKIVDHSEIFNLTHDTVKGLVLNFFKGIISGFLIIWLVPKTLDLYTVKSYL